VVVAGRIQFDDFELDPDGRALYRAGSRVKLQQQPFDVLTALLERPGRLMSRDELRQRVWPADTFVDFDHSLNISINKLRTALDDSAEHPRFIETIPRRGYRFIGTLTKGAAAAPDPEHTDELSPPRTTRPRRNIGVAYVIGILIAIPIIAFAIASLRPGGQRPVEAAARERVRSIAVMPLDDLSPDAASARYFADSMTDALITSLAQLPDIRVISRTSVVSLSQPRKPLPEIAATLGVDSIVEGTVVRLGNRVRITAQLVDGATDRHLWARSYDREMRDVLALQHEVTTEIASEIGRRVAPSAPSAVKPAAFDEYLRGRFAWNARTETAMGEAIEHFIRATQLDPSYAPAYAGLADCYATLGYLSNLVPSDGFQAARAAAERALRLDQTSAEAHASLGYVHFYYDWDFDAAERELRRALSLNPSYATGHQWYAVFLTAMSRPGEARAEIERASGLDPLSAAISTDLGFQLYYTREYDRAVHHLNDVIGRYPRFPLAHLWLGRAYQQHNRFADAIAEFDAVERALPDWPVTVAATGSAAAWAGDVRTARHTLDRLHGLSKQRYVTAYGYALVHAALGEHDQAIDWLERGVEEHTPWMVWLKLDPRWGVLSSDPRFTRIAARVGLP